MVTPENSALNLKKAKSNVRERLGLPADSNQFSYDQRRAYLKELAAEVLKYPLSFTPDTLNSAAIIAGKNYAALDNTDFAWGDFAAETAANAKPVFGFSLGVLALAAVVYFAILTALNNPRRHASS